MPDDQKPQPDKPSNPDHTETIYRAATDHYLHAEGIRWTLLNNYFVGSSILFLAWTAVCTSTQPANQLAREVIMAILALTGAGFSFFWILIQKRSSEFLDEYRKLAEKCEEEFINQGKDKPEVHLNAQIDIEKASGKNA